MQIPFVGLYQSKSPQIANIECENWYINKVQTPGGQTQNSVFGTPGIKGRLSTGEGTANICRGMHTKGGIPYTVNGNALYSITQSFDAAGNEVFSLNSLGSIEGTGLVSMSDNGTQLMILVPNGKGYIYNENDPTPFQEITDAGFTANGNPQYVTFVDSFFIVTTDTKKFIRSDSNDGLSWSALNFGSAESDPDPIVSPNVFKNRLYIGGTEGIEAFQNIGAGGFSLQRTGLFLNKGVKAPLSFINTENTFMFIGAGVNESPAVWAFNGDGLAKVSNTAIENELLDFTAEQLNQSFAWAYAQDGAYFVGFSLPTKAFVYDTVSQEWHERTSTFVGTDGFTTKVRWRVNALTDGYGRIWVGDSQDGRIGTIEIDEYMEYNEVIQRTISAPMIHDKGNAVSIAELELQMEAGVGDETVTNPQIRMDYSDDGFKWSNEMWRGIGKIGETMRRTVWSRLGRTPRFRIFRFQLTDAVKPVIIRLDVKIKAGTRGR